MGGGIRHRRFILMVHMVIARVIAEDRFPFIAFKRIFRQIYNKSNPRSSGERNIYLAQTVPSTAAPWQPAKARWP